MFMRLGVEVLMRARRAAPGTRAPRGFAPGYDPAALQAAPASIRSGPGARLVGRMPFRPGYPAGL